MSRVERLHREKVTRYSIRKYSFGAASVAVAALFMFLGNGAVSANELSKQDTPDVEALAPALDAPSTPAESTPAAQPVVEEPAKPAAPEVTTPALDKKQLENYISEVKSKLSAGTYANKTEESLALLNGELASAESTLASATTQDELTKAYQKLVTFVSSGLKNKPKEPKETPEGDTTNGQPTLGKKAENTEPKSESNSIENTGSHDSRNGKALDKNNAFRAETDTEKPTAEIPFSNGKDVYVYGAESTGFDIKIKDNSGFIASATVKRGGNQDFTAVTGEPGKLNAQYGYTVNEFTTKTEASESNPAVIHYTGVPGGELNAEQLEKAKTTGLTLGWRFVTAADEAGNFIENKAAGAAVNTDPGSFNVIVKPQTYKYDVVNLSNDNKISVANAAQLTAEELANIKNGLKVEYSKNNDDAQLESKKGTLLDNALSVVDTVTDSGSNLVVTYKDGSTDTIPKGTLIKSGNAPTVNMPYPASGGPREKSILSTDNTITGTGTPGSKITIQVESVENGELLKEITDIPVDASGNWTVTLENGLNSNVPVGGNSRAQNFFAPKNPVKVFETKDGIETASTNTYVSIGASKVLPSNASKDKASVVAGSKEVVLEVPHDAGISYFWYHDKDTGKEVQIDIQRDKEVAENLGIKVADKDVDKVAIKSVTKGEFYNTITLEMKKNIKEGVVRIISHNNDGTHSSKAGKVSTPVTNEKPVVASVSGEDTTTVITNSQLNLLSLVKVTDHEDDQPDVTLGDRVHARVISVDGNTSVREVDTSEAGEHTVVYKAVDSQGKESDEYTHKVIVRENKVPEVSIPYSVDGKKDIYVYANEDIDIDLKFTDDSGKIKSATILQGGNNALNPVDKANPNVINNEYGTTFTQIDGETATTATEATPAIVKITGKMTKDTPGLVASKFPTDENGEYRVVTRYATSTDMDGGKIVNRAQGNSYASDPGAFALVIKAQTAKYDIKELADAEKVVITDKANIPQTELDKIKENLQLEYSKKNEDKNLEDKKGTAVDKAAAAKVVETLEQDGENLVVTYKDGSKDTIPVEKVVKLDKQPAIDAVNAKADEKIKAIEGNANLSPAEIEKAKAKVNEDKQAALDKIDDATNKAAIDAGQNEGTAAVAKVNPVAKEAAKQAVTDALKAKNAALDEREDLTQKEKEAAKAAAKVEADKAIAKINEQPDTAPTPVEATTAQKAVDTEKTDGTTAIGKINPIGKQAALDKIDEALKAKEKEIDDRTDLTDEEKKEVKDRAKEIADTKKEEINAKKNNADTEAEAGTIQGEINTVGTDGAAAITALAKEPAKKPEANQAVEGVANNKKAEIEADNTLSPEAKKNFKMK